MNTHMEEVKRGHRHRQKEIEKKIQNLTSNKNKTDNAHLYYVTGKRREGKKGKDDRNKTVKRRVGKVRRQW